MTIDTQIDTDVDDLLTRLLGLIQSGNLDRAVSLITSLESRESQISTVKLLVSLLSRALAIIRAGAVDLDFAFARAQSRAQAIATSLVPENQAIAIELDRTRILILDLILDLDIAYNLDVDYQVIFAINIARVIIRSLDYVAAYKVS